ncbi:hypothetical protein MSG28_011715 [Choristoneura fumiferana]|uniref:Uncharacterized protein n=1 Tax=Choristoneura fumiferana TaxID=7141 RepID=A0ACC0KLH4_CHOFU|nr:hypothetical protein MSG28_011715 [Choristoneura fumiferana]
MRGGQEQHWQRWLPMLCCFWRKSNENEEEARLLGEQQPIVQQPKGRGAPAAARDAAWAVPRPRTCRGVAPPAERRRHAGGSSAVSGSSRGGAAYHGLCGSRSTAQKQGAYTLLMRMGSLLFKNELNDRFFK